MKYSIVETGKSFNVVADGWTIASYPYAANAETHIHLHRRLPAGFWLYATAGESGEVEYWTIADERATESLDQPLWTLKVEARLAELLLDAAEARLRPPTGEPGPAGGPGGCHDSHDAGRQRRQDSTGGGWHAGA